RLWRPRPLCVSAYLSVRPSRSCAFLPSRECSAYPATMLSLPEPIANYFAADLAGDASALARCFTVDGVVRDEGGTFNGAAAIRRWNEEAKAKYRYTVEPVSVDDRYGEMVVVGKVVGDFPGSPITLQHIFHVAGDKIVFLEIR